MESAGPASRYCPDYRITTTPLRVGVRVVQATLASAFRIAELSWTFPRIPVISGGRYRWELPAALMVSGSNLDSTLAWRECACTQRTLEGAENAERSKKSR